MKITKRQLILYIFLMIVFVVSIILFYINSPTRGKIWPWIISFIIIASLIFIGIHVEEEKLKKIKSRFMRIPRTTHIILILLGGGFLGIKFNSVWAFLIAFIILYIFFEYILVKIMEKLRKKTEKTIIKKEHDLSKKSIKKYKM